VRTIDFGGETRWQVGPDTLFAETREDASGSEIRRLRSWRLPDGEPRDLGRVDWSALGASKSVFVANGKGWLYAKGESVYLRPLPAGSGRDDRLVGRHPTEVTVLWPLWQKPLQFYSLDRAGEIRIWDLSQDEPKLARVIPRHESVPEWRVPDPTLRWAADYGVARRQLRVWNLDSWPGARPLTLRRSGSWYLASLGFHPRGDWVVASTHTSTRLTFWPLRGVWPSVVDGYSTNWRTLAFSPDGRWLVTNWPNQDSGPYSDALRLWPLPGSGSREVRTLALPEKQSWAKLVFDPLGRFLFVVGFFDRVYVVPLDGSPPRKLEGFSDETLLHGAAVSPSGRRVATAFFYGQGSKTLRVWDLETGELRLFDLPEGSPSKTGYERGVEDLAFADESTLYTAGDGGVRRWNLATGAHELVLATKPGYMAAMALGPDGHKALVHVGELGEGSWSRPMEIIDLATGGSRPLPAFGERIGRWIAVDASGTLAASGDQEGIVRVGRVSEGEPHLLVGHKGPVNFLAISPDLRWIASTGEDNTLRLWPMPDLSQPPRHTLPHDELIAKLKSVTNIRVVRDPDSEAGWKVELEPFPGWAEVPTW
jgi:WD40 repeat protein